MTLRVNLLLALTGYRFCPNSVCTW